MAWMLSHQLKRTLILFFVTLIPLFAVSSGAQSFRITQNPQETTIFISKEIIQQAKLLNFSPASKILLKVTPKDVTYGSNFTDLQIPEKSGIFAVKNTPLDGQNYLLVIELFEKLPFSYHASDSEGVRIVIEDQVYRDVLENYYRKGLYYQQKGDEGTALQYYRKIVFKNRKHPHAYYKAGQIRFQWKQYRLAEINFNHALKNQCDSLGIYDWMAKLYDVYGKVQLAQEYREKFLRLKQTRLELENRISPEKKQETPIEIRLVNETTPLKGDSVIKSIATEPNPTVLAGIPSKVYAYILGIVILSLFIIIWVVLTLLKKRKQRLLSGRASDVEIDLAKRKEKFLKLTREFLQDDADEEIPRTGEENRKQEPDAMLSDLLPPTEEFIKGISTTSNNPEIRESDFLEEKEETNRMEIETLARELKLGIGEIELALNLSNQKPSNIRQKDVYSKIRELYEKNYSIPAIAREVNLGQNEVELFLKFSVLEEAIE